MRWMQSLFLGVVLFGAAAQADGGPWVKYGQTSSSCKFKAIFQKLKSYPFARLDVQVDSRGETVPMALKEEVHCKKLVYETAYPRSEKLPTFVVEFTDFCEGHQADMKVTLLRSSVAIECPLL